MSSYQIIKLKNGEDLICNVLDNENGRLKVTTPLKMETVNRISKKGLTESLALPDGYNLIQMKNISL